MNFLEFFVVVSAKDQASSQMDSISSGMIAKAQLMADGVRAALSTIWNGFTSIVGGAREAYAEFEQLKGGMETFFGASADTVISNAQRAFHTAGMSAIQYMQTVTSFATTLVNSVAQQGVKAVGGGAQDMSTAVDNSASEMQRAFSKQLSEQQKAYSKEYEALQESLSARLDALREELSTELEERKKAFDSEYEAMRDSLDDELEALQKQQEKKLKAVQKQQDKEYKALQKSLSKQADETKKQGDSAVEVRKRQLDQEYDAVQKSLERQVKEYTKATDARLKLMESEYKEQLKLIDKDEYDRLNAIDKQIDALNAMTDAEEKAAKDQEDANRVAELQKVVDSARTAKGRAKAQEELNAFLEQLRREDLKDSRKAEIERLKDQKDAVKESADEQKEALKESYDEQRDLYKEQRSEELDALKEANKDYLKEIKQRNSDEIASMKESNSEKVAAVKEANSEQLEAFKEGQKDQLDALRESQSDAVKRMREANANKLDALKESQQAQLDAEKKANDRLIKEQQRADKEQLSSLKESQQAQLDAMKDSQQAQLDAARAAASERAKALKSAADETSGYVKASEEDMAKAAELADRAVIDMADNANKMGTSIQSIQDAYAGFAKDNFTMLDNLHLGYGGTREEMERLLSDAEKIMETQGQARDLSIDSFADIVEAIHVVQQEYEISGYKEDELKQKLEERSLTEQELHRISQDLFASRQEQYGSEAEAYNQVVEAYKNGSLSVQEALILTGTTSYEASETIQGSINTLQAAWENWLLSLADDEADVGETTDNLVDAAIVAGKNIIPRVGQILSSLAVVIGEKGPEAFDKLHTAFLESLPPEWRQKVEDLEKKFGEFLEALKPVADWLERNLPKALEFFGGIIESFINGDADPVIEMFKGLVEVVKVVGSTFYKIGNNIKVVLADLVAGFEGTGDSGETIFYDIGKFFGDLGRTFKSVVKTIGEKIEQAKEFFGNLKKGAEDNVSKVIDFFKNLPDNIVKGLGNVKDLLFGAGQDVLNGFWDGLQDIWNDLTGWVSGIGEWIQENKGPKEYDLGLLVKNGQWIMTGLEEGLRNQFENKVMPYVEDMADTIGGAFDMTGSNVENSLRTIGGATRGATRTAAYNWGGTSNNTLNVYVDKLVAQDQNDIHRVADELNSLWVREVEGAIA